ncbi:helix-turn-helix domain-containing protein [Fructobacillus ficulneus]|uniref:HTH cro/C1-type domain-containing protein n=1 Tax=Fructobacillus ficulneus TaxID=157463 RepID=A0A0K8MHW9_9LACO|nr:helix-turn-helix transcriptional regulator [Fructobacillus ficulneus]GAO99454.1 hypothetical protein FFIC_140480 [Fructobacillus ficulneus]
MTNFDWRPPQELTRLIRDLEWREYFQQSIAREIRQGRKKACLTQAEVADALHICQSAVSKYESGKMMPDLAILLSFCYLYGWTMEDLLLRLKIRTKGHQ